MVDFLIKQQWFIIGFIFLIIIFYISYIRKKDKKWIEKRFGINKVRVMSFGVSYFGSTKDMKKPKQIRGFLLLLPDRVFFYNQRKKIKVNILGKNIIRVYHDTKHKGVNLNQSLVKIDFKNSDNKKECVAFKVPYPRQWIQAIEKNF